MHYARKKNAKNQLDGKISFLKQLMGYPDDKPLTLNSTVFLLKEDILMDTLQTVNYNNRIEYQLLQTNLHLQKSNIEFNRLSFLPSLSAYANYNINYQNDDFSELYKKSYPNSIAGLSLTFPIFQGTRRIQEIKKIKTSI